VPTTLFAAAAELDDLLECNQEIVTFGHTCESVRPPRAARAPPHAAVPGSVRRAIAYSRASTCAAKFRFKPGEAAQALVDLCRPGRLVMVLCHLGIGPRTDAESREAAKLRAIAQESRDPREF